MKLLNENIRENLHDTGINNDLLDLAPKPPATKTKIGKLDYIEFKNIYALRT